MLHGKGSVRAGCEGFKWKMRGGEYVMWTGRLLCSVDSVYLLVHEG